MMLARDRTGGLADAKATVARTEVSIGDGAAVVHTSIPGLRVARELDRIVAHRGRQREFFTARSKSTNSSIYWCRTNWARPRARQYHGGSQIGGCAPRITIGLVDE